jgi:hypothetical protein
MSIEGGLNQESMERTVLVDVLKTRGIEDVEARELLVAWTEKQEQKVESAGTREAQIQFEIDRAELYIESGFKDDGAQALEDALTIATQEGLEDLVKLIEEKLSSI